MTDPHAPTSGPDGDRTVVVVPCRADDAELVADRLFSFGASAVGESPVPGPASVGLTVEVTADLPTPAVADALAAFPGARVEEVERSAASTWRDHLAPVVVAGRLVVRPPWCPPPPGVDEPRWEVVVDPGDAFGSGTHPTTVGCLAALVALADGGALAGASVLDIGCGTGVLGLAALELGAARLLAVDTDPAAVAATTANAARNGLAGRTEVRHGSLDTVGSADGLFDLVLANLLAPVFDDLGTGPADEVAPGGVLVVSGLLADQVDRAVGPAVAAGLVVDTIDRHGDWAVVVLRRSVHTDVTNG